MSGNLILHVEDNQYNRKIIRDLLSKHNYEIMEAHNGEAALDALARRRPDLILMDIQLPKLSGLEVTRRIRADPSLAQIPIIAITSFALSGDERTAFEAGCSAYIAKPFRPRDLLEMIQRFLGP
ncbi:putative response regulator in two-component regulatory system (CheY-like protein) [Candidatus Methylomirabilis oxygeniifera]|uniref:Putative response regulator in two-component regulatory system (CheY-like protein) n=1 Tax=Methylomirabilis oxygeniifera TaxID=671143 RepID=D5MK45_METO1|nr:putative response regulator in two-component regulatory system (CheY-like protein) [Candidatus Methylomirabilis oxyfera]